MSQFNFCINKYSNGPFCDEQTMLRSRFWVIARSHGMKSSFTCVWRSEITYTCKVSWVKEFLEISIWTHRANFFLVITQFLQRFTLKVYPKGIKQGFCILFSKRVPRLLQTFTGVLHSLCMTDQTFGCSTNLITKWLLASGIRTTAFDRKGVMSCLVLLFSN